VVKSEYDKAIADYTEAIRLDPQNAQVYTCRGWAWQNKSDFAKALADYNEAARLDPKDSFAVNNRNWLRATFPDGKHRDGEKASRQRQTLCRTTNNGKSKYMSRALIALHFRCWQVTLAAVSAGTSTDSSTLRLTVGDSDLSSRSSSG
jgi:tetratricopeptide (TPR) repeat protein